MSIQKQARVIFACHPSLYSATVLSRLLCHDAVSVLGVVESTCIKRRNASRLSDIKNLLATSGLRYSLYLWCITDVFALLSKLKRIDRARSVAKPTVKRVVKFKVASVSALSRAFKLPVYRTRDINSSASHQALQAMVAQAAQCKRYDSSEPIYFVTAMFNQKLSAQTLAMSGLIFINLHPGSLPGYRGIDPVLDALVNGETAGEVSLHKTEAELDTGNILASVEVPLNDEDSLLANNSRFFSAGADMLCTWLERSVHESDVNLGAVQQGQVRYSGWPTPTEVAKLKRLVSLADMKTFY